MAVHRNLGPGCREDTYQRDLEAQFTSKDVPYVAQKLLDNEHIAQVIGCLAASHCSVGLPINLGTRSLQWRRVVPPCDVTEHRVNRRRVVVPDWVRREE